MRTKKLCFHEWWILDVHDGSPAYPIRRLEPEKATSRIAKAPSEIEKGISEIQKAPSEVEKGTSKIQKGRSEIEKATSQIEKGQYIAKAG
jgi:hypothetical protein